ncbi:MAG TPA: hypothetical protein VG651_15980 [Stellaceae bacterium]|nr:hypothetical protein [Stellaceae bacterium]
MAVLFAAGCQPLPHPFADDRPSAALIAVPDNVNIAVLPVDGEPRATAAKLPAAIAREFLKHSIPASEQSPTKATYQLDGRIEEHPDQAGKSLLTVHWRLRDPRGKVVSERSERLLAPTRDWAAGNDEPITQLAAASAAAMAARLMPEAPKEEQQAANRRVRVAVRKVSGAPGDGNTALAASLGLVLKHQDIDLVDPAKGKPDLAVDCEVRLDPVKDGKQHVKIVWHVARAGGDEIGQVAQENDVPRGQLDGAWGDIAYSVATAAQSGIMQLVDRASSPRKPATAAMSPPPPDVSAIPRAGTPSPPPVPGNIDSPEVTLPPVNVKPQAGSEITPLATPDTPVFLPYRGVPIPH